MLKLYIANKNYSSWSLRPWVLMRELAIAFEEILVPFGDPDAFRSFSPSGKVPCLVDGDTVIWDSLSIVEYLAEQSSNVWPANAAARAWARSAVAEMHSGFMNLRSNCPMNCGLRVRINSYSPALMLDLDRIDELWNDGLSKFGGPFLSGIAFTAVDAYFAPVAFRVQTYELKLSAPSIKYAHRLLALPSMKAWYESALNEVWRYEKFEAEVPHIGTLLNDFRHTSG